MQAQQQNIINVFNVLNNQTQTSSQISGQNKQWNKNQQQKFSADQPQPQQQFAQPPKESKSASSLNTSQNGAEPTEDLFDAGQQHYEHGAHGNGEMTKGKMRGGFYNKDRNYRQYQYQPRGQNNYIMRENNYRKQQSTPNNFEGNSSPLNRNQMN